MKSDFDEKIENPYSPIAMDLSWNNRPLLIAFGGLAGKLIVTPFEFFNLTKGVDMNRIYIRDLAQSWYHQGLSGLADNIDDVAHFLKDKIAQSDAGKVIMVGNSMGGFAAILFGILLDADVVHAFSPQTFIDRFNRFRYFDRRWRKHIQSAYRKSGKKYFDLKPLMANRQETTTCSFHIYYSQTHRLDTIHANRLGSLRKVELHAFEHGGHRLVKHLRDTGELNRIINEPL